MDKRLLEIIVCPVCKGALRLATCNDRDRPDVSNELICERDRLAFAIRDGIPVMLADSARSLDATGPATS